MNLPILREAENYFHKILQEKKSEKCNEQKKKMVEDSTAGVLQAIGVWALTFLGIIEDPEGISFMQVISSDIYCVRN